MTASPLGFWGKRRLGLSDRRLFRIGDVYKVDISPDLAGKPLGFANSFVFPDGKHVKVGFPESPTCEVPDTAAETN